MDSWMWSNLINIRILSIVIILRKWKCWKEEKNPQGLLKTFIGFPFFCQVFPFFFFFVHLSFFSQSIQTHLNPILWFPSPFFPGGSDFNQFSLYSHTSLFKLTRWSITIIMINSHTGTGHGKPDKYSHTIRWVGLYAQKMMMGEGESAIGVLMDRLA